MSGRLWAHVSSTSCSNNGSCVARPNHRLIKATANGVFCISRDPERQRYGEDIKLFIHQNIFTYSSKRVFTFTLFPSPSFLQYKHLFVHIGPSNPSYSDPVLESIDVRQIYDKFSEKKGGLKELYEKGPRNAFFLVKFWVSTQSHFPLIIVSTDPTAREITLHTTRILKYSKENQHSF